MADKDEFTFRNVFWIVFVLSTCMSLASIRDHLGRIADAAEHIVPVPQGGVTCRVDPNVDESLHFTSTGSLVFQSSDEGEYFVPRSSIQVQGKFGNRR